MDTPRPRHPGAGRARTLRLALDAVMLVLLTLMYQKQVISLSFHEVGGLALIGLLVIHLLVGARKAGATMRGVFAKNTPGLVRARYIVDTLLLLSFITVGISGVLISKVVFQVRISGNYRALHNFASALAVILTGVHLGLHADPLVGRLFRKSVPVAIRAALAVVLACIVGFGGYSLVTSSFASLLTAPLQAAQFSRGDFEPSGAPALDGSSGALPSDISELPEFSQDNGSLPQSGADGAFGGGRGQGRGDGQNGGEGQEEGRGEEDSESALLLIAQYTGIISFFAAATYGVLRLAGRKKKHDPDEPVSATLPEIDLQADILQD